MSEEAIETVDPLVEPRTQDERASQAAAVLTMSVAEFGPRRALDVAVGAALDRLRPDRYTLEEFGEWARPIVFAVEVTTELVDGGHTQLPVHLDVTVAEFLGRFQWCVEAHRARRDDPEAER